MAFGRSALSLITLCLVLSFVAAAPPAGKDLAINHHDGVETQLNARNPTSTLQERYNPPDTCGCTEEYLRCIAKLANWNYIDSCNFPYFSCNSKCPDIDSVNRRDEFDESTDQGPDVEVVPSKRARVGGFFSGLGSVIAGTIGKSHHNKPKETSRSLPFLAPSYANAGVYYTPPPKHKKPQIRGEKGEPIVQPAPGTPWPPVKRGQDLSGLEGNLERRDNTYTVVKSDTLYLTSKAHNVALAALTEANPQLNGSTNLSIGQVLNIPIQSVQTPPQTPQTGSTYTVVAGDTLYLIAKSHGVSLAALMVANPQLGESTMLLVGQTLTIPPASGSPGKRSQQFCDCASFFTGKQLASCITMCMKADTPQEPAVNGKRDDTTRPESSPQGSNAESGSSSESEQTNRNGEDHSTETTSFHHKDIHSEPSHSHPPTSKRTTKTSTCGCEKKGYNWSQLNACITSCYKTQPNACILIIPPGGNTMARRSSAVHKDTCLQTCTSKHPHNASAQLSCSNQCFKGVGSNCVAIVGPADKDVGRNMVRSLPYIPAPYAQPNRESLDYEYEDEGLDKGVLLLFFSCLMAPVLLVVWLGRRRGYIYARVRSED